MATSIKLNSPYYWDSSNVVYNRTPLNTVLGNIGTSINNLNSSINTLNTNVQQKRMVTLWSGSTYSNSIGTYATIVTSESVYNFDFLLVDISAGNSTHERITLVLPTGQYAVTTAVSGYLFILGGYRASVIVQANGYSAVGFCIKEVQGWAATEVRMNTVRGVKI